jgi:hypothetical protein
VTAPKSCENFSSPQSAAGPYSRGGLRGIPSPPLRETAKVRRALSLLSTNLINEMSKQLTIDDARQSLTAHVAAKGEEIRAKYGPHIGWNELQQIVADRSCVRYPCQIVFGSGPLLRGEFAYPVPKGQQPEDGFSMCVHPKFASQPERVAYLVLYQLVLVNYGDFASPEDAETFGAAVLGISRDEYYQALCQMADELVAHPQTTTEETRISECIDSGQLCDCKKE